MWLQIFRRNALVSIFRVEVKIKAECITETSVTIYSTTQYYNPEDKTIKKRLNKLQTSEWTDLETAVNSYDYFLKDDCSQSVSSKLVSAFILFIV
jgi:hypothetical protein